jgi:hypothetical protein
MGEIYLSLKYPAVFYVAHFVASSRMFYVLEISV